jgi:hypothetical protein
MIKTITLMVCFCTIAISCKKGNRQVVVLDNISSENIFFVLSKEASIRNNSDISAIRTTGLRITQSKNRELIESSERYNTNIVKSGESSIILTSEAAGIFLDVISIGSVIQDRYDGRVYVFVVKEGDLSSYSDLEIIKRYRYSLLAILRPGEMVEDSIVLKYYDD